MTKKQAVKIIFFLVGTYILYNIINFFVYEDNSLNRLKLHEFYNQKENVDVVFVGNSRVLNGIDPTVADDVLGCNTFNLGTSS